MPSLQATNRVVKGLCLGYPGSAKTGSLASLINSGRYNVRILDFDGNYDPLYEYVKPEFYNKVEIKTFQDKLKMGPEKIIPQGPPKAFEQAMKLLDNWKYTDQGTGEVVDYGPVSDWGPQDVLVLDSLTHMGRAAFRRTLYNNNRIAKGPRIQDWGQAMADQEACMEVLTSNSLKCNVLVLAHLKLIGPPEEKPTDSEETKEVKKEMMDLIPSRLYPSALGKELPPKIAANFPYVFLYRSKVLGKSVKRTIVTTPQPEVDVKVPLVNIDKELDVGDGLLKIFEKVQGHG
jgi:hypothetical protein